MVEPNSQSDQDKITQFIPTKKVLFAVGNSDYTAVQCYKPNNDSTLYLGQFLNNLDNAPTDCDEFLECLKKYNFHFEEDGGNDKKFIFKNDKLKTI